MQVVREQDGGNHWLEIDAASSPTLAVAVRWNGPLPRRFLVNRFTRLRLDGPPRAEPVRTAVRLVEREGRAYGVLIADGRQVMRAQPITGSEGHVFVLEAKGRRVRFDDVTCTVSDDPPVDHARIHPQAWDGGWRRPGEVLSDPPG